MIPKKLYGNKLTGRIYNKDAMYDLWVAYVDAGLTMVGFEDWRRAGNKGNFTEIEGGDLDIMEYKEQYEIYKKAFELVMKDPDGRERFLEKAQKELKKGEQAE